MLANELATINSAEPSFLPSLYVQAHISSFPPSVPCISGRWACWRTSWPPSPQQSPRAARRGARAASSCDGKYQTLHGYGILVTGWKRECCAAACAGEPSLSVCWWAAVVCFTILLPRHTPASALRCPLLVPAPRWLLLLPQPLLPEPSARPFRLERKEPYTGKERRTSLPLIPPAHRLLELRVRCDHDKSEQQRKEGPPRCFIVLCLQAAGAGVRGHCRQPRRHLAGQEAARGAAAAARPGRAQRAAGQGRAGAAGGRARGWEGHTWAGWLSISCLG